jgi:hypothetical protein
LTSGGVEGAKKKKRSGKKGDRENHFSLQLKVRNSQIADALEGAKKILAFAKKEKVVEPMLISLRGMVQKLEGHHRNLKKVEAKAAQADANQKLVYGEGRDNATPETGENSATPDGHEASEDAISFSVGARRTKPLKPSMQAKTCNFKTFQAADFQNDYYNGKVDINTPFKIVGADAELQRLREKWTLSNFRAKENSTIKYLSPMMAKMMHEGQRDPEQAQTVEMLQPQLVKPAEYFAQCFGQKKKTGTETEYCEQKVPLLHFGDEEYLNGFSIDAVGGIALKQVMDVASRALLKEINTNPGLDKFVHEAKKFEETLKAKDTRQIVFGPAGSGTQMSYTGVPLLDSLVHGARRYFVMSPNKRKELLAKMDGQFGTAFNFFEDQYAELQDDHGLKTDAKDGVWECSQEAGEIVYIPVGSFRTVVNMQDSVSFSQELLLHVSHVQAFVEASLWRPQQQRWNAGICLNEKQIDSMPGLKKMGIAGHELVSAIEDQLDTPQKANNMILESVLVCKGAMSLAPSLPAEATICGMAYAGCIRKLKKNFEQLQLDIPGWLSREMKAIEKADKKADKKKAAKGQKKKKKKGKKPKGKNEL